MKDLTELSKRIYNQNKEIGWWDESRSFSTFICLFHSELSEAMEGLRKNLMDDHLPHYEMFWVEVADFVIRCLDWLGSREHDKYDFFVFERLTSKTEFLAEMHGQVSSALKLSKDPYYHDKPGLPNQIAFAVFFCFDFADVKGVDLLKIIDEKVEYNKHRADHKRENRGKPGGKEF